MNLDWKGAPGNVIARGAKGLYTIQSITTGHVLQGIGDDDKPMAELGLLGRLFRTLDRAKDYAAELEAL